MKHFILIVCLFYEGLGTTRVIAQQKLLDSLSKAIAQYEKKYPDFAQQKNYFELCLKRAEVWSDTKIDSALNEARKCQKLPVRNQSGLYRVRVLNVLSNIYTRKGDFSQATQCARESLDILYKEPNSEHLCEAIRNLAFLDILQGEYQRGLKQAIEVLETQEKHQNFLPSTKYINTYTLIGMAYTQLQEENKALHYYKIGLTKAREHKLEKLEASLIDKTNRILIEQGNYKEALPTQYKVIALFEKFKAIAKIGFSYKMLGDIYTGLQRLDSAKICYEIAVDYDRKSHNRDGLCFSTFALGRVYLDSKEAKKALPLAQESYQLALEAKRKDQQRAALDLLSKVYALQKNYELAYKYAQARIGITDTLAKESNNREIGRIEAKYAYQMKENELKQTQERKLASQRFWTYMSLGAFMTAMVVMFLVWRNNRQKQRTNELLFAKNQEILQQKEEITVQAEQLEIANKTKDQLFSIVAHDLRSPMMAFQGLNQQIKFFLRKNRPEKLEELGENIEKTSTRLNTLLDNLLQWAMLQKQVITVNAQSIDLQEAVTHCLSHFEGLAQSQQVTLHQQVGKERITTDYNILQTILRNLVSNALKFTPEGGHIYLAYQQEGRQDILSVRDTGAGMSAEKVSTLFQSIQLKSEQGLRGEKGTGIGLQLCYELAQQINATLSVESQEGQGTTFSLTFSN
jgi:signal transduction histidine kinase